MSKRFQVFQLHVCEDCGTDSEYIGSADSLPEAQQIAEADEGSPIRWDRDGDWGYGSSIYDYSITDTEGSI
jgi:hypothetical protein